MGHVADWALTAKLISTLFAHTEKLGDLNDSKELPPRRRLVQQGDEQLVT
jgi:hypothetical protein